MTPPPGAAHSFEFPPRLPVAERHKRSAARARRRVVLVFAVMLLLVLLVTVMSPLVGSTEMNWRNVFADPMIDGESNIDRHIFFTARFPRVLFGLAAGASLALAGAVYQAILRNDLAEPFTLGVSGGASVGALLAMMLVPASLVSVLVPLCAFGMAALAILTIYGLARLRGRLASPATLLLAGVTLNFLFGAIILLIQYLGDPYQTLTMVRWMMGGLDVYSYKVIGFAGGIVIVGTLMVCAFARSLDIMTLGDSAAHHLGVRVEQVRLLGLAIASALAAYVVAFAGPIGFVGLIVPHVMRRLVGADHRVLLPASALAGSFFLVLCDTSARMILRPAELPVGIVTAFLGAPFFLWLLFRKG